MSSTASKVADIFTAAGAAFNRLGELTVQLHPLTSDGSAQTSGKWGNTEIEMLKSAVQRFGEDLKKISEIITTKSMAQIKSALKQRMYEHNSEASPKKTPQKRSHSNTETTTKDKTDEVAAKKMKEEAANSADASTLPKNLTSPAKETENLVDVESLEDTVTQNPQKSASGEGKSSSDVSTSDIASS